MTDSAPEVTSTQKKKRSLVLPIALGVVAVAFAGFVASRAGLDKALVKEQVDRFIATAQEKAKQSGRDVEITYTDIEIEGGLTNRHAVLKEPTFTVRPLVEGEAAQADSESPDAMRVSTARLDIYPEASDLSALRIEAPAPIDFVEPSAPEKILLTITSASAPSISFARSKQGEVEYADIAYRSPLQTEFKYLKETQATGEEDATPELKAVYETLTMAVGAGSGFKASLAQNKSGLGTVSVDVSNLVLTPSQAPGEAIQAPKVKGEWSNVLNEKKRNVVKAFLDVGPVTSGNAEQPYQPVVIALDMLFEGNIPSTPEAVAAAPSEPSVLALKTFKIETRDATLSASADFTANATDSMPVGSANLSLTNVPYVLAELRKAGFIDDKSEPMVLAVLQKVSGTPAAELKDLALKIERPKDGNFKIGSATVDEILAVLIGQAMNKQAPASGKETPAKSVPQLPPADKPKAAPIAVPDQGARG